MALTLGSSQLIRDDLFIAFIMVLQLTRSSGRHTHWGMGSVGKGGGQEVEGMQDPLPEPRLRTHLGGANGSARTLLSSVAMKMHPGQFERWVHRETLMLKSKKVPAENLCDTTRVSKPNKMRFF